MKRYRVIPFSFAFVRMKLILVFGFFEEARHASET
jgi:hypothetical protein